MTVPDPHHGFVREADPVTAPESPVRVWAYPVADNGPGPDTALRAYPVKQDAEESRDMWGDAPEDMGPVAEYVRLDEHERLVAAAVKEALRKTLECDGCGAHPSQCCCCAFGPDFAKNVLAAQSK